MLPGKDSVEPEVAERKDIWDQYQEDILRAFKYAQKQLLSKTSENG